MLSKRSGLFYWFVCIALISIYSQGAKSEEFVFVPGTGISIGQGYDPTNPNPKPAISQMRCCISRMSTTGL
jgi:hypothetical protein